MSAASETAWFTSTIESGREETAVGFDARESGVRTNHDEGESRRLEDGLSRSQVEGAWRLSHMMEGESARAAEETGPKDARPRSTKKHLNG